MRFFSILVVLCCAFALIHANCTPSITTARTTLGRHKRICSGQLLFADEFEFLDKHRWKSEETLWGGGNNEFEWYTDDDENRFVHNGKLYIRPTLTVDKIGEYELENGNITLEGCTDNNLENCHRQATPDRIISPIRSARLNTANSFSFKFGRVEIVARTPTGDWLWPAIWLLPTDRVYGEWPRSGEIDLLESRGNRKYIDENGGQTGVERAETTLHFGPRWDQNGYQTSTFTVNNPNGYNNGFHKYELLWTDKEIKFSIDGTELGFVPAGEGFWRRGGFSGEDIWQNGSKMAPFDEEFHLILNLAVGGTNNFFPDNGNQNGKKPWANSSPATAATDFWKGRSQWLEGWNLGENHSERASLIVDSIKVWAI